MYCYGAVYTRAMCSKKEGFATPCIPVLRGRAGTGKSTFVEYMLPLELRNYRGEDGDFSFSDLDFEESIRKKILQEVPEMKGAGGKFEKAKVRATQQFMTLRPRWAKKPITIPINCLHIGTMNENGYFPKDTDSDPGEKHRRFLPVDVGTEKEDFDYDVFCSLLDKERDQLFAQAIEEKEKYKDYMRIPPDLVKEHQEMINIFEGIDAVMFEKFKRFWYPDEEEKTNGVKLGNILYKLGYNESNRALERDVKSILTAIGMQQIKTGNYKNRWEFKDKSLYKQYDVNRANPFHRNEPKEIVSVNIQEM